MVSISKTLNDYLCQPNPTVNNKESWKGSNTKSRSGKISAYKDFNDQREWKEFTHETLLQTVFGRIIENDVTYDLPNVNQFISSSKFTSLGESHAPHLTDITDEESLKDLLKQWNKAVVCAALIVAQRDHRAEERISMALGTKADMMGVNGKLSGLGPDWAGIQDAQLHLVSVGVKKKEVRFNILPGDAKLSTKWTSEDFKKSPNNFNLRMPGRQILTYCECAKSRYGYLLSSKDLNQTPTALSQQDELEDANKEEDAERVLEWKSIPWETENEGERKGLTINLALWWLHIMAAKEHSVRPKYQNLKVEYKKPSTIKNTRKRPRDEDSDTTFESSSSAYPLLNREEGRISQRRRKGKIQDAAMSFQSDFSVQV